MTNTNGSTTKERRRFTNIDPSAIRHPLDKLAAEQLQKLRGFDFLVAKYLEFGFERSNRILINANSVKVGPQQIPVLYEMLREGCAILDMPEPDLYVSQTPIVNAYTFGHTKPYIVIFSGLLELLDEDEVLGVIAHELGHIKCNHVLYTMMVYQINVLIAIARQYIPAFGQWVGLSMQVTIQIALINWRRRAELSGDRAALLVTQDPRTCVSMLAKLAGGTAKSIYQLDPEEFLKQAYAYKEEGDSGLLNRIYQLLVDMQKGLHPFAVERAHYLNEWLASDEYAHIMSGDYPRKPPKSENGSRNGRANGTGASSSGKYCEYCGSLVENNDPFCSYCGHSL
jgi:Zn-dependent protease with chaperone function